MSKPVWYSTSNPSEIQACLAVLKPEVGCDIETDGLNPLTANIVCMCIADGDRVIVIDPWIPSQHAPLLTEAFASRTVVFHNGPNFDLIALERDGVVFGKVEDTLIAAHSFASHFPLKLDQQVSTFCDSGPWKIEVGMRESAGEKGAHLPHNLPPETRDR